MAKTLLATVLGLTRDVARGVVQPRKDYRP